MVAGLIFYYVTMKTGYTSAITWVWDKYYADEPAIMTENKSVTILWDMPIQTDKEIDASNRPGTYVFSYRKESNISLKSVKKALETI